MSSEIKSRYSVSSPVKYSLLEILSIIVLSAILLYHGKALFIPLSFALLISFILYPINKRLEKKGWPRSAAIGISISTLTIFLGLIVYLLIAQVLNFGKEWPMLREKITNSLSQLKVFLAEQFGLSIEKQTIMLNDYLGGSGTQIFPLLRSTFNSVSEGAFMLLMIPFFSIFILFQREKLAKALCSLFPASKTVVIYELLVESIHSYFNFVKGMLLVYFIVGLLNSIGLMLLGIPHPFLLGFITAVLTFVPYVGIIIGSLLPISIAWIAYNSIWYPLGVVLVFAVVQVLEAYVIFPLAVSQRLNVNTLAVLVVIVVGGIVWGAAGMILFIPFLGIMKLIADRSEGLKTISILLDGDTPKRSRK